MPTRYMTAQRERKITAKPTGKSDGLTGERLKKATGKAVKAGFPTCYGTGGTFGPFKTKAMP